MFDDGKFGDGTFCLWRCGWWECSRGVCFVKGNFCDGTLREGMFHDRTFHEVNVSWWGCFIMRTVRFAMRMLQNGVWVQEKCNLIAELGARQHCRDNVTIFFRPKIAYNFIMYIFVVSSPFIHQGLNIFRNFLVTEAPLRCHVVTMSLLPS